MKTFLDIQTEVKDLINFTDAADQDFTNAQVKRAINLAYQREITKAKQTGGRNWFKKFMEFTWTAGDITKTLPTQLIGKDLISFHDVTNADPGYVVEFDDLNFAADIHWKDQGTLQWGSTGPSEDKTFRVTYFADAEELVGDEEEPVLVPADHCMLLVWSAACYLRTKADEESPAEWRYELGEARMDYWKYLSRGRPQLGNEPTVKNVQANDVGYDY